MGHGISGTGKVLVALTCIAYQYLLHLNFGSAQSDPARLALLCLPFVGAACWIVTRSRNKLLWLAILLASGAAVYLLEQREKLGLTIVSGLPHAAAYLFLLWHFGRTLARGREPIITRFARRVHGSLQAEMERFTRNLTIAWCVFFAVQLAASAVLLAFAFTEAWSLFINVLNLPLLGLMFAGQWAYGAVRHPDHPRASIGQAIDAFVQDASLPGGAKAR